MKGSSENRDEIEILDKPITRLAMSVEFSTYARLYGINTLREMLQLDPTQLVNEKRIDHQLIIELSNFLIRYSMLERMNKQ